MKFVPKWNHQSVSFFTKLNNPPLPLPGLHSPARLFNIAFNADGTIYTNYFGGGQEVEEKHLVDGQTVHHRQVPIPTGKDSRISIHGSGEVRGFIRGKGEVISHLGYELRSIDAPVLLAQHHIGTAGEYITEPFQDDKPKSTAVQIPGLFEQPNRAVFSLHASPEDFFPQGPGLVWAGISKPMDNGRRLLVAVELSYVEWPEDQPRDHEIRVFSKPVG